MAQSNLKFPLDDKDGYNGYITFTPFKTQYNTLGAGLGNVSALTKFLTRQNNKPVTKETAQALSPSNFKKINRPTRANKVNATEGTCTLYLPQSLQFNDGIQYDNVDLGAIGGAVEKTVGAGGATVGSVIAASAENIGQTITDLIRGTNARGAAELAAMRLAGAAGDKIEGAVSSATGLAINPNKRTLLKGVGIRRFTFTFKLIPTRYEEAEEMKKIIKFFRSQAYPDVINIAGVDVGFEFPNKFDIRLKYNQTEVATKILPSFLEKVDVVYNPNSMGMYKDGNFNEIDMTLGFVEERALNKLDISGSGSYRGGY